MTRKSDHPLAVRAIPLPPGNHHPLVPYSQVLPQHEFSIGIIAPKGSGKTTAIINILDKYKGYFNDIVVISPTIHNDDKWDYARKQPYRKENKKLDRWLKDQKRTSVVQGPAESRQEFDPRIPEEHFMATCSKEELGEILDSQDQMIEKLKKAGKSKYMAHRILLVNDDPIGGPLISNVHSKDENPVLKLAVNLRHLSASSIVVSQGYKELPKTWRTNWSCVIVFEIPSEGELKVIYEEHPVHMKREAWQMVYEYCTGDDYNFMFINYQKPKRLRVMKNFEQVVFVDRD